MQRMADDHVPADGDDDRQPRVGLDAGVLRERTVDDAQHPRLLRLGERRPRLPRAVVASPVRDHQSRGGAEQIGDGQADQPRPGRTLDPATHGRLHSTSAQDHDRQQVAKDANSVAKDAESTEDRVDDGCHNETQPVECCR